MNLPRRKIALAAGGVVVALAATLFAGWWQVDGPGAPRDPAGASVRPLPFNEMDFSLSDHLGRRVTPDDWIGRPTLVFFGFTYCPDVCPTTLADITRWLDGLGAEGSRLRAAFITVDPERDTVEAMARYLGNFHPAIVGHTGSPKEIAKAAEGFRVAYERIALQDDYTMNHTASVFVYDARGDFVTRIDYHEARENAVQKIRRALS